MVNYLLEVFIMASAGLILYLFVRALPRVDDADLEAKPKPGLPQWLHEYLERLDEWLLGVVEKFLRRTRLGILKVDNTLAEKMHRFRKGPAKEGGFPADFPKNGAETKGTNDSDGAVA
jgi:hypothetical protein